MEDALVIAHIQEILEHMRPNIKADGGDISFVSFERGIVYVKLHGACTHCPISSYHIVYGIGEELKRQIPDVHDIQIC